METNASMRDHWWWRPGWHIGQRMYTWHITFPGRQSFHEHVAAYQAALRPLPGLDLIPSRWLHLTMQGVGFVDEVTDDDVNAIVKAARIRCASVAPFELTFESPVVDPEAIMFALHPAQPARALRAEVRAAIGDVWGTGRVPEAEDWSPHVSVAYSSATGPSQPFAKAVSSITPNPTTVQIKEVELIVLNRDNRMYEWETYASVKLEG